MNAKIIGVANQKGGCGKTTIATTVAVGLQRLGHRVLLVDADMQGSAGDWSDAALNEGFADNPPVIGIPRPTIAEELEKHREHYDYIVVDSASGLNASTQRIVAGIVKQASLVLLPVNPSPYDVWACSDLVDAIKSRQELTDGQPVARFLLSMVRSGTLLSDQVRDALADLDLPVLESSTSMREVYRRSAMTGRTVFDDSQVRPEAERLVEEIVELVA